MPPPLPLVAPVMCIWGSNTGVGKTLVSAGMAAAAMRTVKNLLYLKPLQTGFPVDSDARLVARVLQMEASSGPHASALLPVDVRSPTAVASHPSALLKTLFAWKSAVSPHLAVEYEGRGVADSDVVAAIRQEMADFSGRGADAVTLIETAGGVASPGPSGTLQCDLLRPLRLPCLLVGDGRLGGISATLAAYELLVLRGYTVPFITLMEPEGLNNWKAIQQHVDRSTAVLPLSFCRPADGPPSPPSAVDSNLAQWLEENAPQFDQLLSMAAAHHMEKVCALEHAAQQAQQVLWWPFTQHGSIGGRGGAPVTTIDSRAGEHFAVLDSTIADQQVPALQELYDGCASWWTQVRGCPILAHRSLCHLHLSFTCQ